MKKAAAFEGALVVSLLILLFAMLIMVTPGHPAALEQWNGTGDAPVYFLAAGNGGMYTFQDGGVSLYDTNGKYRWTFAVAPQWKILMDGTNFIWINNMPSQSVPGIRPIYAVDNGTLYLYALENATSPFNLDTCIISSWAFGVICNENDLNRNYTKKILAISSDGRELWNYTFQDRLDPFVSDELKARDGLVYFYHDRNETALDDGRVLFTLNNVSDPVSVDDQGNLYAVKAAEYADWNVKKSTDGFYLSYHDDGMSARPSIADYYQPSSVIESFYPNGTLRWTKDIKYDACRQYFDAGIRGRYDSLPLYHNGTLLVPLQRGIIALNADGSEAWRSMFYDASLCLLDAMPMDENGSIYLRQLKEPPEYIIASSRNISEKRAIGGRNSSIYVVSSGGKSILSAVPFDYYDNPVSAGNGIMYTSKQVESSPGGLMTYDISAYDLGSGALIWSYRLPIEDVHVVVSKPPDKLVVDYSHSGPAYNTVLDPSPGDEILTPEILENYRGTMKQSYAIVMPAGDRAYVNFRSMSSPYMYNKNNSSKSHPYIYSNGIYALDRKGSLLWYKSLDSPITALAANNTTIIYGTKAGGISTYTAGTAGLTLAALFYVFIRFFLVGAVSRARDRLGINRNRNRVLEYVKAHPGSTLMDIARYLKMNFGTVRYHVAILEMNHRIASIKADDRYVRYFGNSGMYTRDERVAISLMRREGIRKVLGVLLDKPGLTNAQLSKELRVSESAMSKSMKALVAGGLVVKEPVDGRAAAYAIDGRHMEIVASMLGRARPLEIPAPMVINF